MKIISYGGMIGVGKTTAIKKQLKLDLLKGIKSKAVYELYEKDDTSINTEFTTRDKIMTTFLQMYYENAKFLNSPNKELRAVALNVTFAHQSNFLSTRASKIIEAIHKAEKLKLDVLYLDRTIYEDIIFTKRNLFNEPLWWSLYNDNWKIWRNTLKYHMKKHDVKNIILTAPTPVILDRIKKRGRAMEQEEGLEAYFTDLNENYVKELKSNFIMQGEEFEEINNAI